MSFKIYFLLVLPLLSKQSEATTTDNCKNLKCPNQEDSTCVKVTYRKGFKNIEYNVIVYNKCEIGYIKCHPGMKAYILPMRNCHSSIKRSKREIKRARRTFHRIGKGKKLYLYGDNLSDPSSDDVKNYPKKKLSNKKLINKVRDEQLENEQDGNENDNNDENNNDQDDKIDDDDTPRMDSTEALVVLNSTSVEKQVMTPNEDHNDKDKEDEGLDSINVIDEEQGVSLDDTLDHSNGTEANKDKESFTDRGSDEKNEDVAQNEETRIDPNSGEKKEVFNDDIKVPKDYDHTEENNANLEEDNKDCPSTCSLRDMMICARCNHGVYRTFMSVCHLRAFLCAHTHEKLSLVSRQPCIQSAPFLSDLPPSSGRVHEPSDNDRVLQFIRCRAEGRLDKGDPKCNFNR